MQCMPMFTRRFNGEGLCREDDVDAAAKEAFGRFHLVTLQSILWADDCIALVKYLKAFCRIHCAHAAAIAGPMQQQLQLAGGSQDRRWSDFSLRGAPSTSL